MHSNRLLRLILLVGLGGAIAAIVKALTRDDDPLPAPVSSPAPEPWPPLRPVEDDPDPVDTKKAPEPAETPAADAAVEDAAEDQDADDDDEDDATAASDDDVYWVEPTDDGDCPPGYPVKANMKSKIFHVEGQLAYERTTPQRCYRSAEDAESDGLRAAKR